MHTTLFGSGTTKKFTYTPSTYKSTAGGLKAPSTMNANSLPLLPTPNNSTVRTTRRLTTKEMAEKREKGECFWCKEKFTPSHNCRNRQLFNIELVLEEENCVENEVAQEVLVDPPHISIHALMGIPSYSTMKITGSMGTRKLHILVDSGSTHNFIDASLAKKLQCTLQQVPDMKVTVANGNQLICGHKCTNFKWMMQGVWFSADVLVLPLENYDMVLGVQWLALLGDITWNFTNLTIHFSLNNKVYTLKGTESNVVSLCSAEKMSSLLNGSTGVIQSQMYGLQLMAIDSQETFGSKVSDPIHTPALQQVLDSYNDIFQVPTTLPPKRPCDHQCFD